MLEKLAWRYLARRMESHRKAGRHHEADHIRAALATRPQKQCALCCILENTDWLAWAVRFDPTSDMDKDSELYASIIADESRFGDVVRRAGLD
ncbi:hypothetical protein SEA_SPILLED_266 [Streptomyces phage Spilled]|uniref:Uncharacterized protein n=2 Tax=Streptomyces virus Karimac TaxID=2846401 RepID=A0A5Q2WL28_9CAUD|nr:hypothetical protein SEA_BIRCHLYN_258 [Streptomyces phage Birchlyn]QFP97529.1 hypothetical protein SEA_ICHABODCRANE_252 [Streptomyces phage IchabodCrane]QGH79106.1 hypothetical protein SEA_TOMSAWYER_263 [Streptomyces phage TomSawyer]QGH79980.1 hypothetical protein SEA_BORDEAUX_256 [Streptomyces phage Bordeaux]QPL13849.1 hypothetical protein SEA_MINDFLAYER_251 [Streptomyces phage MindFlayer]QRI45897.1 hypothetical protein SEA_BATTUTA_256 [Streptomyces phage Battuta]URM86788.1 hypothetical p